MLSVRSPWRVNIHAGLVRHFSQCSYRPDEHLLSGAQRSLPSKAPARKAEHATVIRPEWLAYHWETAPATKKEREYAETFFKANSPRQMFMAAEIHKVQFTDVPEVAFFGRSNVGKSTLLNAIMGREICYASNKVGRTRTMNAYAVGGPEKAGGSGLLTIMDMPGYGKGSVKSWGTQLSKYLEQRKELKRVFFLMDPLHGLKDSDRVFLKMLRERAIPHQVVMNKIDRIFLKSTTRARIMSDHMETRRVQVEKMMQELKKDIQPKRDGPPALGEILACSGDMGKHARYASEKDGVVGINAIRWAILRATGLDRYVDPVERKELSGSMTSFAKQDKSLPVRDPDSIAYSPHTYA